MSIPLLDNIGAIAGPLATIAGAAYAFLKISNRLEKRRDTQADKVVQKAKEEVDAAKLEMDGKYKALEVRLDTLETSVKKDLDHLKENYTNEIASLAEKIQLLREDLRSQHVNLLGVITKLVDKA